MRLSFSSALSFTVLTFEIAVARRFFFSAAFYWPRSQCFFLFSSSILPNTLSRRYSWPLFYRVARYWQKECFFPSATKHPIYQFFCFGCVRVLPLSYRRLPTVCLFLCCCRVFMPAGDDLSLLPPPPPPPFCFLFFFVGFLSGVPPAVLGIRTGTNSFFLPFELFNFFSSDCRHVMPTLFVYATSFVTPSPFLTFSSRPFLCPCEFTSLLAFPCGKTNLTPLFFDPFRPTRLLANSEILIPRGVSLDPHPDKVIRFSSAPPSLCVLHWPRHGGPRSFTEFFPPLFYISPPHAYQLNAPRMNVFIWSSLRHKLPPFLPSYF